MTSRSWRWSIVAGVLLACAACTKKKDEPPTRPPPAPAPQPEKPKAAPIPVGWFSLTPQLAVPDVAAAVDYYTKAFAAEQVVALPGPDGALFHAEVKIGDSIVMIDLANDQGLPSPAKLGGTPVTLMLYVADVDATFGNAIAAGGEAEFEVDEVFWGDRFGQLTDPFGHRWAVATHIEDLTDAQIQERSKLLGKRKRKGQPAWKQVAGTPANSPQPPDYHSLTMSLVLHDAASAIDYYKTAFGAAERSRILGPGGKLSHAELKIGDSLLVLADEFPEQGGKSAKTLGGSPVMIHHYVPDVNAVFARALAAGGNAVLEVKDVFWGDRYGAVIDPVMIPWGLATHIEDLTQEQMSARMKAEAGAAGSSTKPPS